SGRSGCKPGDAGRRLTGVRPFQGARALGPGVVEQRPPRDVARFQNAAPVWEGRDRGRDHSMRPTHRLAVATAVAAVLLHAGRAWAPYHVVVVDQVFFGTADCPNAQYVMMRQLAPQQRFINGQKVTTQNADGSAAGDFGTFGGNVPNGN